MVSWGYCIRTYNMKLQGLSLPLVSMKDVKKGTLHFEEVCKIQDEFRAREVDGYIGYQRRVLRKGGRNTPEVRVKVLRKYMVVKL